LKEVEERVLEQVQHEIQKQQATVQELFAGHKQSVNKDIGKLSKDVYYELDQLEKEIGKLKQLSNAQVQPMSNGSTGRATPQSLDEFGKYDIRELKLKQERFNEELAKKANISDVCALLDLKANVEEVNKSLEAMHTEVV